MTHTLKALLASAAIGLALTACKGAEKAEEMAAEVVQTINLPAGVTKIETVASAKGDQVVIPYTKYVLDNGLSVVLHEDKSDPLVHVIETVPITLKQSLLTNWKKCSG